MPTAVSSSEWWRRFIPQGDVRSWIERKEAEARGWAAPGRYQSGRIRIIARPLEGLCLHADRSCMLDSSLNFRKKMGRTNDPQSDVAVPGARVARSGPNYPISARSVVRISTYAGGVFAGPRRVGALPTAGISPSTDVK